jgi:heme A synthase
MQRDVQSLKIQDKLERFYLIRILFPTPTTVGMVHTHVQYLLFLLLLLVRRLVTKKRQKDIVTNLDRVDV